MGDRLGLRRRVDRHPAHLRRLDCARSPGRSQRLGDERLQLLGDARRLEVRRAARSEIGLAAEIQRRSPAIARRPPSEARARV